MAWVSLSSLRVRLILFVFLALIPALGMILYMTAKQEEFVAEDAKRSALRLARLIALEHKQVVEGAHQLLVSLAQLPQVRAGDPAVCSALFAKLEKQFPRYVNFGAIRPNGDVFCSAVPFKGRVNVADRLYFRRALEARNFAVGEYQVGRITGKPTVNFGYPVLNETGGVDAVVFAALDLTWLSELKGEVRLPPDSSFTLIDRNGTILVRSPDPEKWVGQSVPEAPIVRTILAQGEGVAEALGVDGIPRLYGFTPLEGAPHAGAVYVSIGFPRQAAFAESRRVLTRTLLGLGLVSILVLVAAWVGGDLMVGRRVRALVGATQRLAAGDLSVRSGPPYARGELGELASVFDEMAEALQRKQGETESANESLRASEERIRLILETANDAFIAMNQSGLITEWNRQAEVTFGWSRDEAIGRPLIETIVPPQYREAQTRGLQRFLMTGEGPLFNQRIERTALHRDGHEFPVEVTIWPVRIGRSYTFTAFVRDITERKRSEEELQRQREALFQSEKLAAMGSLLAGVAHELNNPLSVVMGRAALLRQIAGEGLLAQQAAKIAQAADRCGRIVRNFLALARQRPPERSEIRLNQIVQDAVELLAYPLRVDNVEVKLDLDENLPAFWADPHQLHQVIVNLVTNAHQAMRQSPQPRQLTLTTRYDASRERVALAVADTGPGIPPELHARIFEPFFTTKPPGQGTGLGLSLCQGIVESHGGTIRVESQPRQGATFVIELPVETRRVAEAQTTEALPSIPGKRILVVDDEPEVAGVLADLLSLDGHEVEIVENGARALDRLRERAYDLILSDLRMPELDGPGLYRELERRQPELCRRLVFLTGDTLSPEIREFLGLTGALSLEKPFVLEEVRQVVQHALRV